MDNADPTTPARSDGDLAPAQDLRRAFVILALWTAATLYLQWDVWPDDLSAVYIAGALWQRGQPDLIYAALVGFFGGTSAEWIPLQQDLGIHDEGSFPYVYPPLWAVLTGPLTTVLSPQGFANAVACLQVPMLAGSAWLAMRIMPAPSLPAWMKAAVAVVLLSTMVPAYSALRFGNPSIIVNFLTLLAFDRLLAGRPVIAGASLALAAAIKLSPATFVLVFLLDRQWRAITSFIWVGAALGLLSLGLAGLPLHVDFLASLRAVSDAALLSPGNVSLRTALLALASGVGLGAPMDMQDSNYVIKSIPVWLAPFLALTAVGLIIAFGRALRHWPSRQRLAFGLFVLSVILPLFGPLGWLHYYVLPMLLMPGIVALVPRGQSALLLIMLALASLSVFFAELDRLPWPAANYVWLMCMLWLVLLGAFYRALRPPTI